MSTLARTLAPKSPTETNSSRPQVSEDDVGPSRVMEIGLHGLVTGLLIVSIIGIAYVYGFNLETGSLLDNISAAVRALGVDGGFFLGLYFARRLWMLRKRGWGDGIKTTLFGFIWFLVALLMASLSWFSNTHLEQMRQWTRAKLAHEAADICSAFLIRQPRRSA